ncbi:tRNA dimethylallyltransferase isoform X2 [Adelges cooleyi]|uniref:tRNA dimethylallyltransferase isoform X2 n=1 Tax=Adelges cooleyi TaxID=133065 RepID=UPI002180057E|nr:tRNA dimethylallyltransferase isoform X2 [Adelges cooleyi]
MFWKRVFEFFKLNCVVPKFPYGHRRGLCRRESVSYPPRMDTFFKDRLLFVVAGCTGTGKTKLGVRLAKALDGEVVSADSIQVYRNLDVATNKATQEETQGVPHHMMGTVDWDTEFNVHEYRKQALKIIRDIYSRGKVPIVVGGTYYYIESIIYNNLVWSKTDDEVDETLDDPSAAEATDLSLDAFRQYRMFRHSNDAVTAVDTADAARHLYRETLAETARFVKHTVSKLSHKQRRNTFADAADGPVSKSGGVPPVERELSALYSHGVRCLDALTAAIRDGLSADTVRFDVLAADGDGRFSCADVQRRLESLMALAEKHEEAVKNALYKMHRELEMRAQRVMLALLADQEKTVVDLLSPEMLKAHALYFDPVTANTLHPHNVRKVFRCIQIHLMRGRRQSELLKEQRTRVNGSDVPVVALRFREVHMMWLTSDMDVLGKRLDERTDQMIDRGLIRELCEFKKDLSRTRGVSDFNVDFTKGIFQCIGLKQFQQYLELPEENRDTQEGRKALEDAVLAMKLVTKNYARRQTRWINNRFLHASDKQVGYIHLQVGLYRS